MKKSNDSIYDYIIVGAGLFGAVFTQQAVKAGKKCLIIDKRRQIGGNLYTENIDSINVHKYGAHIFHTSNREIWNYINQFADFNNFINSPLANYNGKLYNLPFNMNTFYQLWGTQTPLAAKAKIAEQCKKYDYITHPANLEEHALKMCGDDIYNTFIKGYTEKQWGRRATELPSFIIKRIPLRFVYNNNYFNDTYQGIPVGGYTPIIESMIKGAEVQINTDYFENKTYFDSLAPKMIFTGRIDEFFDFKFGKLEYRSLHFEHERLEINDFQGNAVVNYNEFDVPFTRIIEHKHFEFGAQPFTIVSKEFPDEYSKDSEPYYPVNDERNHTILGKYKELAKTFANIYFGGRLAQYAYFDMDDTIEAALEVARKEFKFIK